MNDSLMPHIRVLLDDLISITKNIAVKRLDIARKHETEESILLSNYYINIVDDEDSYYSYRSFPHEVLSAITEWRITTNNVDNNNAVRDYLKLYKLPYLCTEFYPYKVDYKLTNTYKNITRGREYSELNSTEQNEIRELIRIYSTHKYKKFTVFHEKFDDSIGVLDDYAIVLKNETMTKIQDINNNPYIIVNDRKITDLDERCRYTRNTKTTYIQDNNGSYYYYYNPDVSIYYKIRSITDYWIYKINEHSVEVPVKYRDTLKGLMRIWIKEQYCPDEDIKFCVPRYLGEGNDYYRELNGLPPVDNIYNQPKIDRTLIDEFYKGDDPNPYIYNLTDDEISIIEENGMLNKYIKDYPSAKYLRHLGSNRVDVVAARKAAAFDLIKTGRCKNGEYMALFRNSYETAKNFILHKYNHEEIFDDNEYYGSMIAFLIVTYTMCICMAESGDILTRDKYIDAETVRFKLESFNLNVFDDIPLIYRKRIARKIKALIHNKGTDDVYKTIYDIFDIVNVDVCKYYLRNTIDYDNNNETKLSFSSVDIDSKHLIPDIVNRLNQKNYDLVTTRDIFWATYSTDKIVKNIIKDIDFNYMDSKYIGITNVFNLSQLTFDISYILNFFLDISKKNIDLKVKIESIDTEQSVFNLIVAMFAIQAVKYGYDGNIPNDPISIASVYRFNLNDYVHDSHGEKVPILDVYQEFIDYNDMDYRISEDNRVDLTLDIPKCDDVDITLNDITASYNNNTFSVSDIEKTSIYDKLTRLKVNSTTVNEYLCYDRLIWCIGTSRIIKDVFKLPHTVYAEVEKHSESYDYFKVYTKIDDPIILRILYKKRNNMELTNDEIEHIGSSTIYTSPGNPNLSVGLVGDYCVDMKNFDKHISYYNNEFIINDKYPVPVYVKENIIPDDTTVEYKIIDDNNIIVFGDTLPDSDYLSKYFDKYPYLYYFNRKSGILYKRTDVALTYMMYLKYKAPTLYKLLQYDEDEVVRNSDGIITNDAKYVERILTLSNEIVLAFEKAITDRKMKDKLHLTYTDLFLINKYIRKLINVFKSYTIDIDQVTGLYSIDDKTRDVKILDYFSVDYRDFYRDRINLLDQTHISEHTFNYDNFVIHDELSIEERKVMG